MAKPRDSRDPARFRAASPLVVEVGVGGLAIAAHPERLATPALGSCIGVALWDPVARKGALAHVMLPAAAKGTENPNSGRFAAWAVPELVRLLVHSGATRSRIKAKLAGGAAMFGGETLMSQIGERNAAEVRHQLAVASIPIIAEDVGGNYARSIELLLDSGVLLVRSYKFGTCEL